ncbi:MAG: hydantoinase/oxoprolinase family protein [Pseudomonadota bacterium]|nr:hydantoinase/oxoprolinase family protein [Pseudomonadota bacterium]
MKKNARLGIDIGGTFTDLALETVDGRFMQKILTTPMAPEKAVIEGIHNILRDARIDASSLALVIHGTTLATNAIIERKGARTALLVTEGFRDSVEMAYENRFEQYDVNVERPPALVPRHLRWPIRERVGPGGEIWEPLIEQNVENILPLIEREEIESIAVGFLHAYANNVHEARVAELLAKFRPDISLSLSSEVCPEVREYERLSTTCANAYVRPLMARYLAALEQEFRGIGVTCPLFLMMSSGGLTTLEVGVKYPIRLIDSGPAGGAILAGQIASACGADGAISFDMGGTTAKICLIDGGIAQTSRGFEVARAYRHTKGSGLPIRIPVVEMVEIGAGGGSLVRVDSMGRVTVGPASAGAAPGPACYGRGGEVPTVTDADLQLGRIDSMDFGGGEITLNPDLGREALLRDVGRGLEEDADHTAWMISEIVDENMANAARVHAVERGKSLNGRTMIAFGGAAPLHAVRMAEKLGVQEVVIPTGAGVGSAIGFLRAPISYEVVRSYFTTLSECDVGRVNEMLKQMSSEAQNIVQLAMKEGEFLNIRSADMRYVGQGHEIVVPVPSHELKRKHLNILRERFDEAYRKQYGRIIPGVDVEVLSWTVSITQPLASISVLDRSTPTEQIEPKRWREVWDGTNGISVQCGIFSRESLEENKRLVGPALITEEQTTTYVPKGFSASINGSGFIVIRSDG